jgi:hypothetical protein
MFMPTFEATLVETIIENMATASPEVGIGALEGYRLRRASWPLD